ncbi:MAG: DUF1501 domain-containing protein, partial [Planctomycetes bacterium]|nr:DUF1501 domain-containing protein [Planctomycetota bacterium]
MDRVRYYDGGRWSIWADGLGSSLELIDPRQDNSVASAWEASDETSKAEWEELSYSVGDYRRSGESELHLFLIEKGACLLDDISVVRSLWTTDNDHGAQLQFHTGRHISDGFFPTIGSWVNYGLGSLNENLPQFVVMGEPIADCCGGPQVHLANYLGAEHDGIMINEKEPLPYGNP